MILRLVSIMMFLLSLLAVPAGSAQKAITADRPVVLSQTSVADAVLTQQRHLIRATASDDGTDFMTPNALINRRATHEAVLIRPSARRVIRAVSHTILPPLRGPPAA